MKPRHRPIQGRLPLFPLEGDSVMVPDTVIEEIIRTLGDLLVEAAGVKRRGEGGSDESKDNE